MSGDTDMVNGPAHYGGESNPYEVIKVCEAWGLDNDAYLFNSIKYIARAGKKNPDKEIEDLKKAVYYLERRISRKTNTSNQHKHTNDSVVDKADIKSEPDYKINIKIADEKIQYEKIDDV